jgi:hypothetical protein
MTRTELNAERRGPGPQRFQMLPLSFAVASLVCLAVATRVFAAGCLGDCDSNGTVAVNELITAVNIALGTQPVSTCVNADGDGNGRVIVSELIGAVNNALTGCPACASIATSASLKITVRNTKTTSAHIKLTGTLAAAACPGSAGSATSYSVTPFDCGAGTSCDRTATTLAPGIWRHQVCVDSDTCDPQKQHQNTQTYVSAGLSLPNLLGWTAFKAVHTVTRADDPIGGSCVSGNCSLRQALAAVNGPDHLIQFDPAFFGTAPLTNNDPRIIQITKKQKLQFLYSGTVLDGTDTMGNPSPLVSASQRVYTREVMLKAADLPSDVNPDIIQLSSSGARLIGLSIRRVLATSTCNPDQDLDAITIDGTGAPSLRLDNRIINCRIDGGAKDSPVKCTGKDGITIRASGTSLDDGNANVIERTEIANCEDKGLKVVGGSYAILRDSDIHHVLDTGVLVGLGPTTTLKAERNDVRYQGFHPKDDGSVESRNVSANGLATDSANVTLVTKGNLIRSNPQRGISIAQNGAQGTIADDYVCSQGDANPANTGGQNGIAVGNGAHATIEGTSVVYSGRNGVIPLLSSAGTILASNGRDAFTQNRARFPSSSFNFNSGGQTNVFAENSQWEHCYASSPPSNANVCDGSIAGLDTGGGGSVDTAYPIPHQANTATAGPTTIASVYPPKVPKGGVVHVFGTGFNAIDGHPSGGNCVSTPGDYNQCGTPGSGLKGTCVEVLDYDGITWKPARVKAVTPTHVVIESPIACLAPTSMRVRRLSPTQSGGQVTSSTYTFCRAQ